MVYKLEVDFLLDLWYATKNDMAKNLDKKFMQNVEAVRSVLEGYCRDMGWSSTFKEATSLLVVDKLLENLGHCVRADRYFNNILYLRIIGGSVWMHQLQLHKGELLEKFRKEFDSGLRDLRFLVGEQ